MQTFHLYWNDYKYFPYEKELAIREIYSLTQPEHLTIYDAFVTVTSKATINQLKLLTYFSHFTNEDGQKYSTQQYDLEQINRKLGKQDKRQVTRYSTHGIHEYKGKFNPQVAHVIINMLGITPGDKVIDPFCGSGTTLLECTHNDISADGFDINPLACRISNAKQMALATPVNHLEVIYELIFKQYNTIRKNYVISTSPSIRESYLLKWFPESIFCDIETLKIILDGIIDETSDIFRVIISNLLRDYSLQEPADLRIRRRKSPMPDRPFIEELHDAIQQFLKQVKFTQQLLGVRPSLGKAFLNDSRDFKTRDQNDQKYHAGITSPPYATALPYIDTQRLSLVWMGMISPSSILELESDLIGSRELKSFEKKEWSKKLLKNTGDLPLPLFELCMEMEHSLNPEDGFRRKAVPLLLYRYLVDMRDMFRSLSTKFVPNAPFALIVGHNHTTLGGKRFEINTPELLIQAATTVGWMHSESIPLQTYKRYGLHHKNAVANETLIILSKQ